MKEKHTHGGKREGSGRKATEEKQNKTFYLSKSVIDKKPTSALVNQLLVRHYKNEQ